MLKKRMSLSTASGSSVDIGEKSPNKHMLFTGISGSGKSVCMQKHELQSAQNGAKVVVFDISYCRENNQIFQPIKEEYCARINWVNVKEDGLNLAFLRPMQSHDGRSEDFVNVVESAVSALGSSQRFGVRQNAALRNAIIFAIEHFAEYPSEIISIGGGLLQQKDPIAQGVYEGLWTVFNQNIFRNSTANLIEGRINIISFSDMDDVSRRVYMDILLTYLWRVFRHYGHINGQKIVISIDEFQNIGLREGSVLWDMLREGRKFGVELLLATQTLSIFPRAMKSVLNQSGTRLFFRQAADEIYEVARMIDPMDRERWISALSSLQVGEAVAVGNFEVNGNAVDHPILVR